MRPLPCLFLLLALAFMLATPGCGKKPPEPVPLEPVDEPGSFVAFTDSLGVTFLPIHAGEAIIGTNDGRPEYGPAHTVKVRDFYMAETELTVAQWKVYFRANVEHQWGMWDTVTRYCPTGDCPIVCLDRDDCIDMCGFLTAATGKTYRLPTEEEWEYCAVAGKSAESFDKDGFAALKAKYPQGHPVKSLKPDSLGLYGMTDNAWEWTSSEFLPYRGSNASCGLFGVYAYVLRGGGFRAPCKVYVRNPSGDAIKNFSYGVRLVREP